MDNGNHPIVCFCNIDCRLSSIETVLRDSMSVMDIYTEYYRIIPRQQDEQLNRLFLRTKKLIIFGNAFRSAILRNTRTRRNTYYSSFGSALAANPEYQFLDQDQRLELSAKISLAKQAFDDWDAINDNIRRYPYIDIRKMSIHQLLRARKDSWCKKENNLHAPVELREKVTPDYDGDKVKSIIEFIKNTNIVNDVGGDVEQLSLIAKDIFAGMKGIRNGIHNDGI